MATVDHISAIYHAPPGPSLHTFWATVDLRSGCTGELIARIAPTMHQHINMRGILTFNLGRHRPRLLSPVPTRPARVRTA